MFKSVSDRPRHRGGPFTPPLATRIQNVFRCIPTTRQLGKKAASWWIFRVFPWQWQRWFCQFGASALTGLTIGTFRTELDSFKALIDSTVHYKFGTLNKHNMLLYNRLQEFIVTELCTVIRLSNSAVLTRATVEVSPYERSLTVRQAVDSRPNNAV